jgi:type IV secretory pathway VirJ component
MRRLQLAAFAAALIVAAEAAVSAPEVRTVTVSQDVLGSVEVIAPASEPSRFVIFISDTDGFTAERETQARKLTERGAAVALIELPKLKATFAKRTDDTCYYVFGELEDLSRMAQRQLNISDWQWPVLLGIGEGGTLAYLTLAQAPSNTAGGAVSIGFGPSFPGTTPVCDGAEVASRADKSIFYTPKADLPAPWVAVLPSPPSDAQKPFVTGNDDVTLRVVPGDDAARFDAALDALFAMRPPTGGALSDLPLTELPASGSSTTLLIFLSGDGGWRDIDKEIGEYLAAHGISVVGVDSLRYFWRHKNAKQIATDLERIADHYLDKWKLSSVALAGYSFGADVLPMTWAEFEPKTQSRTQLIALLGVEPTFDLEVSVSGWLGLASSSNIDMRPSLKTLPKDKVMCVYGIEEKEDKETACVLPELQGATLVERPGGHHFDGHYEPIAEEIRKRLAGT